MLERGANEAVPRSLCRTALTPAVSAKCKLGLPGANRPGMNGSDGHVIFTGLAR